MLDGCGLLPAWPSRALCFAVSPPSQPCVCCRRTFDLAVVEGYSFNPGSGGTCGLSCFHSRLEYARQAGYIHKTINCFGMTCPKSEAYPNGFTVDSMCALVSETQTLFPEMPGVAFYGCGAANKTGMAELLRGISACAQKLYPDTWQPPGGAVEM